MKDRTLQRLSLCFAAICIVIGFAAVAAIRNIGQATATADWVNHTHATIYEIDRILSGVVAGDGAARTYLWTKDASELAAARGEFSEVDDHLETVRALTRESPALREEIQAFTALASKHADAMLALANSGTQENATNREALLRSDPGGATLRELRRQAARLRAEQFSLLDQRDRAAYRQAQTTRWIVGTCVALDLALLGAVGWLIRDDIVTRRKLAATLQSANEVLEERVKQRTQELTITNQKLTAENRERRWSAQSLEHQLRYNQIVVNAASDLVFIVTKSLAVTRINPAVARHVGRPEEDILGASLQEFLRAPDAGASPADAIALALRGGREIPEQSALLVATAGMLAVRFTLLPLRDNDKVVGGVVMVRPADPNVSPHA